MEHVTVAEVFPLQEVAALALWPLCSLQLSLRRRQGIWREPRVLPSCVIPPLAFQGFSALQSCQPVSVGNRVSLLLFPSQGSFHFSWSTRRWLRASSYFDTPISPLGCLVWIAATATCSVHAKLAEGTDP